MWIQRNRKKSIVTGTIMLFVVSFIAICILFLFSEKLKSADRMRVELIERTIGASGEIEQIGQRVALANFYDRKINTLSYNDLTPYLYGIESGTLFFISHGRIVSNFIPGIWTHTGFYLGTRKQLKDKFGGSSIIYKLAQSFYRTGEEHLIIDSSLRRGCAVRDIIELASLESKSSLRSILFFEPKISPAQLQYVLQNSLAEIGKKYDLFFSLDDKSKIYCTELIYDAFQTLGIIINRRTPIFFRNILLPKDMVDEIIEEHMNEFNLKLWLVKYDNKVEVLNCTETLTLFTEILVKQGCSR